MTRSSLTISGSIEFAARDRLPAPQELGTGKAAGGFVEAFERREQPLVRGRFESTETGHVLEGSPVSAVSFAQFAQRCVPVILFLVHVARVGPRVKTA